MYHLIFHSFVSSWIIGKLISVLLGSLFASVLILSLIQNHFLSFRFLFFSIQCHWLSAMPVPCSRFSESGLWYANWPMYLPRCLCNRTDMWTLQRTLFWIWLCHREVSVFFFTIQLYHTLHFSYGTSFWVTIKRCSTYSKPSLNLCTLWDLHVVRYTFTLCLLVQ